MANHGHGRKPERPWAGVGGKMAIEIKNIDEKLTGVEKKIEKMEDKMEKKTAQLASDVAVIQDQYLCCSSTSRYPRRICGHMRQTHTTVRHTAVT
eukprot:COSAG01_NODE_104_length_26171_cov_96.617612_19_plen_95_part_00